MNLAAGTLTAVHEFGRGGARGALGGTSAILGMASMIPGPQQPFVMAASMITGIMNFWATRRCSAISRSKRTCSQISIWRRSVETSRRRRAERLPIFAGTEISGQACCLRTRGRQAHIWMCIIVPMCRERRVHNSAAAVRLPSPITITSKRRTPEASNHS
jgi:hypothetical protein